MARKLSVDFFAMIRDQINNAEEDFKSNQSLRSVMNALYSAQDDIKDLIKEIQTMREDESMKETRHSKLINQFQKDAKKAGRDINSLEEFKAWYEAKKATKKTADIDENAEYLSEAIEFILDVPQDLRILLDLVGAYQEGDKEGARDVIQKIEKKRSRIFDDGLYHLPGQPLQDLVEEFLSDVEEWSGEEEEETEEEEAEEKAKGEE